MSRKLTRLLVNCPNPNDATSFYRGLGPISHLARTNDSISPVFVNDIRWDTVGISHLAFLQRPFLPVHLEAVRRIKDSKVPLWIDYDDDLFCVPTDNPTFGMYADESVRKNVAEMCALADVISVSSEPLKTRLSKLNKNIHVIPNAFDDTKFETTAGTGKARRKAILWRGSPTHQRDLSTITGPFLEAFENSDYAEWCVQFVGYHPWWITDQIKPHTRAVVSPTCDVIEYFKFLRGSNLSTMMVPLADNAFNRAKSNIAWIEASYGGMACIAAALPEFVRPGVLNYSTPHEFKTALEAVMRGDIDVDKQVRDSWAHIEQELFLSKVNEKRVALIDSVLR